MSRSEHFCPDCGASSIGGRIPEDIVHNHVPWGVRDQDAATEWLKTNPWPMWGRFHGIQIPGVYDGILLWECPDCQHVWPRFSEDDLPGLYHRGAIWAKEIMERKNNE